ncbi:Gfo/Idh/MocA family protein [Streptomyces sp. NBC_00827]|uniref:Gfo/Idh/MocA family protein n=1 Tax=Streptomyces sp. NBC_00827 TaxID=2903677 RepID=UPI0038709AA9|nr:Gfo/Idh/MocA family oxidoreductase [Streptomyces sp. NBC_00827]
MLNIGLVGAGAAATLGHIPAIGRLQDRGVARLASVCDIDPSRLSAFSPETKVFQDVKEMIKLSRLDLLVISTPPASHADILSEANDAQVDVLCEKPVVLTGAGLSSIDFLRDPACGTALITVLQYRFSRVWIGLERILRSAVASGYDFSIDVEIRRLSTDPRAFSAWRLAVDSGGILADHAVHYLALAHTLGEDLAPVWSRRSRRWPEAVEALISIGERGSLHMRAAYGEPTRSTTLRVSVPRISLSRVWRNSNLFASNGGSARQRTSVPSLSDRNYVNGLYLHLYQELVQGLSSPSWRAAANKRSHDVASVLVGMLAQM